MPNEPVPLSELSRDLGEPADGWARELQQRGVVLIEDDLGRAAVDRATARALFREAREQEEAVARHWVEVERRAIEADQRFRASLPSGVPVGAVPEGMSAVQLVMMSDPMLQVSRRESVLEHALQNRGGAVIHPLNEDTS